MDNVAYAACEIRAPDHMASLLFCFAPKVRCKFNCYVELCSYRTRA